MVKLIATDYDKIVGQRIKMHRKEKNITVAQLSEQAEITAQQLTRYERGANKINLTHLVKIADLLNVPIAWFFLDIEQEGQLAIEPSQYLDKRNDELKLRLEQHWGKMSYEQKHSVILLLDNLLPIPK